MSVRIISSITTIVLLLFVAGSSHATERPRVIIETDAGGDPDDEQSLVRFLLYTNEFDVEFVGVEQKAYE